MKKITLIIAVAFAGNMFAQSNSCFTRNEFNVGGNPEQIITADFNGDGKKDLAIANNDDNTFSVLLGDGSGNFADNPGITVSAGNNVHGLVSADFNGDGKADLAITNGGDNNVSVYLGNGLGGFSAPVTIAAGANPYGITSGDFNADTKIDLAVANYGSNNVSVLLGNGNGTFQTAVNYNVQNNPWFGIATADLNGDGKADLAVSNRYSNTVSVLLGNGNGTFGSAVPYNTNSEPSTIVIADFNSDGQKDLAIANSNDSYVSLLKGNGDGTFQSQVQIYSNDYPWSVTSGDFNSDGNIDMAVVNYYGYDYVSVMVGDGNGNFGSPSTFTTGNYCNSLVSADFNGDGKADIATSNNGDGDVTVLLNSVLPTVVANASATSVCPGTSVVLTGTGAGAMQTVTYNITASNLYNVNSTCGDNQMGYNYFGFNWPNTLPLGTKIFNIKVELNVGRSVGTDYYASLQGNWDVYYCCEGAYGSCTARDNIVSHNFNNANTLNSYSNNTTGDFYTYDWNRYHGLCPNSTWPAGVYARVTVTYGAGYYTWSGGVIDGTPFTPGSTATYVVAGTNTVGCTNTASVTVTVNPAIVIPSINVTNVTCKPTNCDGSATLSTAVTGGTAPYAYSWSNGATTTSVTGLCAGTYTFTVTDAAGCKNTATASIINTSTVSITPANPTTPATCVCNGTVDMAATGTAPYTYLWSNGITTSAITGLCPGSYSVTATDVNGCKASTSTTVNNSPAYTFSTTHINAACTGTVSCSGSATITPTPAGTYTFVWSPSGGTNTTGVATGLCAGTYTITVTNGTGCTLSTNVVIGTTPVALSFVNINANCSTSCTGKSSVTAVGGTAPYTYAWSPSGGTNATATGLCGGSTYTVTVTDASGCSSKSSTTIGNNPLVTINSFNNTDVTCTGVCNGSSSANVTGGVGPYTYSWSPAAGTNATATGLCELTTYTLSVTDANGCAATATTSIGNQNNAPYVDDFDYNGASCNAVCNGWATVYAYGGSGSLSYAWAPTGGTSVTATGLCAQTNYTLTVTDALGCKDKSTIMVGTDELDLSVNTNDAACTAVCNGTAEADISNATGPFTYLWSNGATTSAVTGLCSGNTFTLTVTEANGCKTSSTFNMYADNSLTVDLDHGWWDRATCVQSCDGIVYSDAYNGYAPYTYLWSNGATTVDASGLCSGNTIQLTVTDSVGCKASNYKLVRDRGWGVKVNYVSTTDTWCNAVCTGDATVFTMYDQRVPIKYLWSTGSTTFQTTGLCEATYTVTVSDSLNCTDTEIFDIYSNSSISFNTNTYTDASCEQVCNGTAKVSNLTGAVAPVTYKWMPSGQTTATATGLCAGTTYSVTVKDANGCTTMNTRYIDYDYDLSDYVYSVSKDASCSGICNGKDSAYSTSGTGPFTYAWFPSGGTNAVASNLCSGDYTVTVTDSIGCKGYEADFIDYGNTANVYINNTDVYCNTACNGTAVAMVSGGTAPYTYAWTFGNTNASVSNLCAGTYGLAVKDANGCVTNEQVTINATSATLTVSVASAAPTCNAACNGTAAATVGGGTGPYAYSWSPSGGSAATATGLCAGTYNLNVTDANGCMQSTAVTLTQPASFVANVVVTNPTSCVEGNGSATANVAGGTAPYTYAWTPTGQITQTAVVLANGTYSVNITDAKGCTATGTGVISCTSGIVEATAAENMFSVYPNPTTGNMVVTAVTSAGIESISIENVLGQTVYSVAGNKNQTTTAIDITTQPAGMYMMRIISGGQTYSQKIVKE